jgi:RNA polymerase sigma-70 factor, ECF subfamily
VRAADELPSAGTTAASPRNAGAARRLLKPATGGLALEIAAMMPGLRRYARSLTRNPVAADDLVQEALARGIEKMHLWQPGTDLRAWLFTVLHNRHADDIRRAARESDVFEPSAADPLVSPPRQFEALLMRDLRRALAKLPVEQRSVVLLIGFEGERYDAVASRLDIPIGTVRSRAARGRQMLRQLMDGGSSPQSRRAPARRRPADAATSKRTRRQSRTAGRSAGSARVRDF